MNAEITTFQLNGWTLARLSDVEDDEPRVPATALAEKLGFDRPRKIRDLIKRMMASGKLPGVQTRPTVGRVARAGRGEVETRFDEFFLTEPQALKVIAKSETDIADQILDEVIGVYVAVRKGLLSRAPVLDLQAIATTVATAVTTAVVAAQSAMFEKLLEVITAQKNEVATGVVGNGGASHIRATLKMYAQIMCPGDVRGQKSWRQSAEIELRCDVGFNGYGRRWASLPSRDFPRVQMKLEELIRRANKTNDMIDARHPRQGKFPFDGEPNGQGPEGGK